MKKTNKTSDRILSKRESSYIAYVNAISYIGNHCGSDFLGKIGNDLPQTPVE